MYIYDKQCDIIQQFNDRAETTNFCNFTRRHQELCAQAGETRKTKTSIFQKLDLSSLHVKKLVHGFYSDFITLPHSVSIDGKEARLRL